MKRVILLAMLVFGSLFAQPTNETEDVEMKRTLVVYYSRTGNTRAVAEKIAAKLSADIEEIIDLEDRSGIFGYIKGGYHAYKRRVTNINAPTKNPADYDMIVIGTPVWAGTMAPGVLTYLNKFSGKLPAQVAFFCTMGGNDAARTFPDMQNASHKPVATMALSAKQLKTGYDALFNEFVNTIAVK